MSNVENIEKARIETLKKYNILDTPAETSFDGFTKLAAKLLDVPISVVSMVGADRIWFKSKYGLDVPQIDREPGFCASAILSTGFYEVQNATKDERTSKNSLVKGDFGLRFYAAYPLRTKDGHNLGTLCVIDKKPRKLTKTEKETLKNLRDLLMDFMELRFTARKDFLDHNRILGIFAHDLKNPLATIKMASEIIQKKKEDAKTVMKMCGHIKKSGESSLRIVEELLETSELNSGEIELQLSKFNMEKLLREVVENNWLLANKKKTAFIFNDRNKKRNRG